MLPLPRLSVVIPVLNDAQPLAGLIRELLSLSSAEQVEIIVVDGGSGDQPEFLLPEQVRFLTVPKAGRGAQIARGLDAARAEWLWLLHADSFDIRPALEFLLGRDRPSWGRFDVRLGRVSENLESSLKLVARMMNWRSRATGICTGDQGIYLHRSLLDAVGGMPTQPLMEDIELSRRLKRIAKPVCPDILLGASGRRWQHRGLLMTIIKMWVFRLRYYFGADPQTLARQYYRG